ncbi:MAG: M3 family oligoendopeptidase [Candidatus Lambdaproteobacteria bacterium]|nr:M3 family oligoendopeptidase [Candidatus Lambdaproteobacteria bacterium]
MSSSAAGPAGAKGATVADTDAAPTATSAQDVTWDLGDLYGGPDDPAIKADQAAALEDARAFGQAFRGRVAGLAPEALAAAVARLEQITARIARSMAYAQLLFAADTATPRHGALLQAAQQQFSAVREHLLFFELEWVALPAAETAQRLAHPALAQHRHFLEVTRLQGPHVLSEPEEKILNLKDNTGRTAFQRLFDEVVNALRCPLDGRPVTLQEALAALHDPDRDRRRRAAESITAALAGQRRVLTFVFNTLVQDHADNDRLRKRPHPMLARNLENEIDQASVDALLATCDAHMPLVARYYRLKRRLLGVDALHDYDRYAPLRDGMPACTYDEAREIVLDAYGAFSPRMAEVAGEFFRRRWIDAALRPGKAGGAFSAGTLPDVHPYILLNYTDTLRDVMVLAHELGHGVHQYLARPQGLFQFHTPLTTAETASVFGEMLVFRRLLARDDDPQVRLALVCGKLEDIFATVHRQAAMTRFEQALHAARRQQGELDAPAIGELWLAANTAMFGDSVRLGAGYRDWWSYIPHFVHTPFYCYAYCFGELLVLALYRQYEEQGEPFKARYLALLSAGGSASPTELLRRMELDIADPAFWNQGMRLIADMVQQAEALAAQVHPD